MDSENYSERELVLVEGVDGTPVFPNWRAYECFRQEWSRTLKPTLDDFDERRVRSEIDSMRHVVG